LNENITSVDAAMAAFSFKPGNAPSFLQSLRYLTVYRRY